MQKNKLILRFISKNLSWGIFRQAITNNMQDDEGEILAYFSNILLDHSDNQTSCAGNYAVSDHRTCKFYFIQHDSGTTIRCRLKELKPYLNESIRAIIRNHIIEDTAEN